MIKGVKGMPDLLPDETWKWGALEKTIREHFFLWGYQELRTPILESIDLFKRGVGEGTDVVSKEMYELTDRNDQKLVMRPEGTAPVIRSLIEHQWMAQREFERICYLGPYFRYEKPQKGRFRQFHQYGFEIVGSEDPLADAECVTLVYELYMRVLGLKGVRCELNSMGCSTCVPPYKDLLVEYVTAHKNAYCEECQGRLYKNSLRILDCKVEGCRKQNQKAPKLLDHLCQECKVHFEQVKGFLERSKTEFTVNPLIVRGLDYYTRTTFEFVGGNLGSQSALGGGGRYDKLFENLGGPKSQPSIGFAGGLERLLIELEAQGYWEKRKPSRTLFMCHLGLEATQAMATLARDIRSQGVDVTYVFGDKGLKNQMKHADRSGARYCLILGENELKSKKAMIKKMSDGTQRDVSLENLSWLKEL